jgi:excisionase family DNA binding protein
MNVTVPTMDTFSTTLPTNRDAYTVTELATRLGISTDTIREAIGRGEIRAGRVGRQFLISTAEVRRLIGEAGRVAPLM